MRCLHLFIILSLLSAPAFAKQKIRLVADPWCPFTCEPGSDKPGILLEVAKEVFEAAGYEVVYEVVSWARAIDQTRVGEFDGILGAIKADAPDFVFHRELVAQQESCFYSRKDSNWAFTGTKSLSGISLAVVKDYRYGAPLDDWLAKHRGAKSVTVISGVDTTAKLLEVLAAKRVDVIAEDRSVIEYLGRESPAAAAARRAGCLAPVPLHIAFSPKNSGAQKLADLFDQGVKKLKASGRLGAIRKKYLK